MILPESVMCIDTHTLSVTKTRFEVSKTEDDVIIKTFRDQRCAKSMGLDRFSRSRIFHLDWDNFWFDNIFSVRAEMRFNRKISRVVSALAEIPNARFEYYLSWAAANFAPIANDSSGSSSSFRK